MSPLCDVVWPLVCTIVSTSVQHARGRGFRYGIKLVVRCVLVYAELRGQMRFTVIKYKYVHSFSPFIVYLFLLCLPLVNYLSTTCATLTNLTTCELKKEFISIYIWAIGIINKMGGTDY